MDKVPGTRGRLGRLTRKRRIWLERAVATRPRMLRATKNTPMAMTPPGIANGQAGEVGAGAWFKA